MKRLNLIILLLASCGILKAQVPGYLGKKLSIGYKLEASPLGVNRGFYGSTVAEYGTHYDGTEAGFLSLNFTHNIDLEYVLSRKVAFRFTYGMSRAGLVNYEYPDDNSSYYYGDIREPNFIGEQYPKLSKKYDAWQNDSRDFDYMNMENALMKIGLTFTRGNYIAPHGRAHTFYFLSNTATCNYVLADKSTPFTTVKSYGIMYERTSRRIIKDCVLLEYGYSIGYLLGAGLSGSWDATTAAEFVTGTNNTLLIFQGTLGIRYLVPKFRK